MGVAKLQYVNHFPPAPPSPSPLPPSFLPPKLSPLAQLTLFVHGGAGRGGRLAAKSGELASVVMRTHLLLQWLPVTPAHGRGGLACKEQMGIAQPPRAATLCTGAEEGRSMLGGPRLSRKLIAFVRHSLARAIHMQH